MQSKDRSLTDILFFSSFYIVVWRFVEPFFLHYSAGITRTYKGFYLGIVFFNKFAFAAGGLSDYISRFLGELYYYPLIGAAVTTAIAYALYRCTKRILSLSGFDGLKILSYLPSLVLLAVHFFYDPQLVCSIGILSALIFVILFFQLKQRGVKSIILYTVFCGVVYYVAGANSLLFSALVVLLAMINKQKIASVLAFIVIGVLVPLVLGRFLFDLDVFDSMSISLIFHRDIKWQMSVVKMYYGLYAFYPIAVIICACFGETLSKLKIANSRVLHGLNVVLPASLVVMFVFLPSNNHDKNITRSIYYLDHKQYSNALEVAVNSQTVHEDLYLNHVINRSLYHLGIFGDEMFKYPQSYKSTLLKSKNGENLSYTLIYSNALELGLIGEAQKAIFENIEFNEGYPVALFELTKIFVFKGQVEAAKIILNQLSDHLIFGKKAKRLLVQLEKDPQMRNWVNWNHLNSCMPKRDDFSGRNKPVSPLLLLLESNPSNKMAFEYFMSTCLASGEFQMFADNLPRMRDVGYTRIPVHFQEAILIYTSSSGRLPDLAGLRMDVHQKERFAEYMRLTMMLKDDPKKATEELNAQFKGSYYLFFLENSRSPQKKKQ